MLDNQSLFLRPFNPTLSRDGLLSHIDGWLQGQRDYLGVGYRRMRVS